MLSSFRVSWRNVTRHKKRFIFTLIAIVLGVAVMTSMSISKATFSNIMDEQEQVMAGNADFRIQDTEKYFSFDELENLINQDEIEEGLASLTVNGLVDIEPYSPQQANVNFTGLSNFENNIQELPVKEGNEEEEGLIITENTAALWEKEVGDSVTFQNMGSIDVTAILYEGGTLNSPKTLEAASIRNFEVIVPLNKLQEWTGMSNQITEYRFQVESSLKENQLLTEYQNDLAASNLFIQPMVANTQQSNDVEGLYFVFDIIAILSIFISAFIAFNMIKTSIVERHREIAIMKSLGYTNKNVIQLIFKEIAYLSIIGTVLGLGIGIWLGVLVQDILISSIVTQNINYEIEILTPVIISLIVGIVFPFISAGWPLYQAGKTPILAAMNRQNEGARSIRIRNVIIVIIGIACTGIGLIDNMWAFLFLFIGLVLLFPLWMKLIQFILGPLLSFVFGFSGKQAVRSSNRFNSRNANTAAMLAVGVSLAIFMSAALESLPDGLEKDIRQTMGGDLIVEKETAWTDQELDMLANVEGVETIEPYTEVPNVTWNTPADELREFSIFSYSDLNDARMFELDEVTEQTHDEPSIYIGNRALAEMGAEVGEVYTFQTPAGEQDFFIKGSVQSTHDNSYVGFMEETLVREELNWPSDFHVTMGLENEDYIPTVVANLWGSLDESIVHLDMMELIIEQAKSGIEGMNELMVVLLILIIAISSIGISNTLFMNTLERTKELGTMRAIGFTKGQARIMIITEGIMIGVAGVFVGTLYGILVIYLNAISNEAPAFLEFLVPWSSLLIAIVGGIIFTLLASWIPSHSASRLKIKEAINYE